MKQISQLFYSVTCLFEKLELFKLNCETFVISVCGLCLDRKSFSALRQMGCRLKQPPITAGVIKFSDALPLK
jgi:hypothetical protein